LLSQEEIEALKNGDQQAYKSLVDSFSRKVYNLCLSLLHNQEDAEDATQEVFSAVFSSINTFKGDSKLSTWIYRISVNKCKEILRKKSRKKRFGFLVPLENFETKSLNTIPANFIHPGIELENQERAAILFGAINSLPENQKIAFSMHKLEGIPYDEIAAIMGMSLSSIESLIFRAKQNLRTKLATYYSKNEQ
jgi:RNA polymerase sigma-70 factor (ECF subfamily)